MAIALNTGWFRTVPGILKILECILVLIVLLMARFGGDHSYLNFGGANATFLGIGASVGYAIIVPAIVLTYLLGASPSILEFIINSKKVDIGVHYQPSWWHFVYFDGSNTCQVYRNSRRCWWSCNYAWNRVSY